MSTPFDDISRLLPKLNKAELDKLKKRINVLSQFGGGSSSTNETASVSDEDFVLRGIVDGLMRINGDRQTVGTLRSQPQTMAMLRKKLPALIEYLNSVDKEQRPGFFGMCVEILYTNLRHLNIPPTAPMLVRHLHRIPALVDSHFPSYHKMGLLRHIIRAKGK